MSERIPEMLAVMTPFPYTIDVRAGISEARAMMAEHDIRHLAVTEERRLIGIVSRRDLDAAQTPARGAEPDEELSVGDAFVDHPYMVDVTIPLDRCSTRCGSGASAPLSPSRRASSWAS